MSHKCMYLLFVCLLILGCDGNGKGNQDPDGSPDECHDGQLLACVCDEGGNGFAFCEDGSWGDCVCDDDGEFPMFCGMCHGDWDYPAPPMDTQGNVETSVVTVGAHRVHLAASDWHRKVECSDCHAVPTGIETPGHVDESPAELTFSTVSTAAGAEPVFDRGSATCTGAYCHGATTGTGGSNNAPVWTNVDGTQAACGACHGIPPGGGHPDDSSCSNCHGNVIDDAMAFVNPDLHINGKTDFSGEGMSCISCHGSEENPAPPVDTNGNSDPTMVTVGAHQSHLGASVWHRDVQCNDCHSVPEGMEDCHNDGPPAEHVWSDLSSADGANPSFDESTARCYDTYCHGTTLEAGGTNPDPHWNVVASGEVVCGDCHGIPPCSGHPGSGPCAPCHNQVYDGTDWVNPQLHIDGQIQVTDDLPCGACHGMPPETATHPDNDDCGLCHGMVWDDDDWVDEELHDNGTVNVSGLACTTCHGGTAGNAAPPVDTIGNSDTTISTVGAHQSHLQTSDWHRQVQCSDCHVVPTAWGDGHDDGSPAENTWSVIASADGASPAYSSATTTCTGSYCHGATIDVGGSSPDWTVVAGSEASCGTCHGIPPTSGHPASSDCGMCHGEVYSTSGWVDGTLHIDGTVQVDTSAACSACHGNPPTPGNQDFAGGGGAHTRHVTELGMACSTCHGHDGTGPSHAEAATVLQANVDVIFDSAFTYAGGTTMTNGATPSFDHNGGSPTCAVGCHNPIVDDTPDLANSAAWTDTVIACSDCHERPGLSTPWNHDVGGTDALIRANCSTCHDTTAHTLGTMALADPDPADGIVPTTAAVSDLCKTCHDGGSGTFFGGTAADVSDLWTAPRAHEAAGVGCETCHGYHGGNPGDDLVAGIEETSCAGASCHDDVVNEMGLAGGASHHHVVDSEQSGGVLECVTCHEPHLVDNSPWQPLTDPDDGSLVDASDVPGDDFSTSDGNTNTFCLDCHDGTWTDGVDIAAELADSGTSNSGFIASAGPTAGNSLHYSHVNSHGFACTHCHNAHSNTGTAGSNRGRLLYNFIYVNTFPYMGKGTCQLTGGPTGCHH